MSVKLQALAAAQERQREAEEGLKAIDALRKAIEEGRIQRVFFSILALSHAGALLTDFEQTTLLDGLAAVREKAEAVVQQRVAEVEGLLR
ncbi:MULTISPECIES: hypothetical protein [unclassified Leucobacter]|uniref:hypothetical protein n=1 Tax=unclassified Leucobacter TaxID=2621730 RepID=UPI0006227357|nr:hypothetical protein [Leucobacter sp. Ag1]KKI20544.1 hypothetical protein XM48_07415 [Leucobacter sp. Ag1]